MTQVPFGKKNLNYVWGLRQKSHLEIVIFLLTGSFNLWLPPPFPPLIKIFKTSYKSHYKCFLMHSVNFKAESCTALAALADLRFLSVF